MQVRDKDMQNDSQDRPEIITTEPSIGGHPYSEGHYYQHRQAKCSVFACGNELSLQETMAGKVCYRHQGGAVIEKQSPAMLMRLQEVVKSTNFDVENKTD